jgi:uncharacterized protein
LPWFTVDTTYIEDRERLLAVRPDHRAYLNRLVEAGTVTGAGPWADDTGGFAIYQVGDRAELDRLLAEDPYTTERIAADRTVREWRLTLGPWAG